MFWTMNSAQTDAYCDVTTFLEAMSVRIFSQMADANVPQKKKIIKDEMRE
jgi:hypothetical protein